MGCITTARGEALGRPLPPHTGTAGWPGPARSPAAGLKTARWVSYDDRKGSNSSRAASLNSLRGSISAPLYISSCRSRRVQFDSKYLPIVVTMIWSARATVCGRHRTRILLIIA
jgi:hypothetical protein